jgi:hypothetical protein
VWGAEWRTRGEPCRGRLIEGHIHGWAQASGWPVMHGRGLAGAVRWRRPGGGRIRGPRSAVTTGRKRGPCQPSRWRAGRAPAGRRWPVTGFAASERPEPHGLGAAGGRGAAQGAGGAGITGRPRAPRTAASSKRLRGRVAPYVVGGAQQCPGDALSGAIVSIPDHLSNATGSSGEGRCGGPKVRHTQCLHHLVQKCHGQRRSVLVNCCAASAMSAGE